ncbi:MAG: hypothetical protein KDD82_28570 [Planctomycetes bacterium]|nr:hypothetical protein [Planctomycetota bacterium]
MSEAIQYSYHLFEAREFRERFLLAVQGDEAIGKELLEAAGAAGAAWTALNKLMIETRTEWVRAREGFDGELLQRTLFGSFARLIAHLRPAYCVNGAGLSTIDPQAFPELAALMSSPGRLLDDEAGQPLEGVPHGLGDRVPARAQPRRGSGVYIPAERLRAFLDAFRAAMPRLKDHLGPQAEEALTVILVALVEAKIKGTALIEAAGVLAEDQFLEKDHCLTFAERSEFLAASVREVARLFGKDVAQPKPAAKAAAPAPAKEPQPVSVYSPRGSYALGERLRHASFGEGEVVQILDSQRMHVRFDAGTEKTLVQGLGGERTSARLDEISGDEIPVIS